MDPFYRPFSLCAAVAIKRMRESEKYSVSVVSLNIGSDLSENGTRIRSLAIRKHQTLALFRDYFVLILRILNGLHNIRRTSVSWNGEKCGEWR